jgi:SAM-dependent methyltransferase
MPALADPPNAPGCRALDLLRCVGCHAPLAGREACPRCGRAHPETCGIVEAMGPLTGRNRVAAAFYESRLWARFEPWERVFLFFQGPGEAAARRKVLRYLPERPEARVLEVGIGSGANLRLLPPGWDVFGVDIARNRLRDCLARHPRTSGRLVLAEAEALPFDDASFDAVWTVGGINYFRDPALALAEMRRVARPGAPLVAADENADLFRLAPGHALGLDLLDIWGLRLLGLDRDFLDMVLHDPADVAAAARSVWPRHRRVPIWNRLGYCLIDAREA